MKKIFPLEQQIFYIMAFTGGALASFAILRTNGILGSAQTSNLAELVLDLIGRDFFEVGLRIIAMLIYAFGLALTRIIPKRTKWSLKQISAFVDIFGLLLIGVMPEDLNPIIALWPIFFMASMQWNAFPGARGYISASIFSTNNYRQVVTGLTDYLLDKEPSSKERALFFTGTLLSFHAGVGLTALGIARFGFHAIWFFTLPVLLALPLIRKEQHLLRTMSDPDK